MEKKLKDLIKIGDTFFFASDDKRENNRWKKTCKVTRVANKFFYIDKGYGDETKCEIINNEALNKKGILVKVCTDVGSYVYGYKNEDIYTRKVELNKLSIQLKQINFFESLPDELQDELYEKLKNYMEK